jgi:hypothetical protein
VPEDNPEHVDAAPGTPVPAARVRSLGLLSEFVDEEEE